MKAYIHHLFSELRSGIRDRAQLLLLYLFPLIFFAIMGGVMAGINPDFANGMVPAMIMFAFLSSTLLLLPGNLVSMREAGILRNYRINGIPTFSILSVPVISIGIHMVIVSVIISGVGTALFHGVSPVNWPGFAAAWLLSYLASASVGQLIGVVAGNSRASILMGQVVYLPSVILGGLMMPSSILPPALGTLSELLPATHGMALFRSLAMGTGDASASAVHAVVLAAGTVVCFALSSKLYGWDAKPEHAGFRAGLAAFMFIPFAISIPLLG